MKIDYEAVHHEAVRRANFVRQYYGSDLREYSALVDQFENDIIEELQENERE